MERTSEESDDRDGECRSNFDNCRKQSSVAKSDTDNCLNVAHRQLDIEETRLWAQRTRTVTDTTVPVLSPTEQSPFAEFGGACRKYLDSAGSSRHSTRGWTGRGAKLRHSRLAVDSYSPSC
jgi:hypothetical protein